MKKGFAHIAVFIIVALLAIGVLGFSYFKFSKKDLIQPVNNLKEINMDKDGETSTGDDTDTGETEPDDWLTFTNHPYAYEFKYHYNFGPPPAESMPSPPPPAGISLMKRFPIDDPNKPFEWCDFAVLSFKGTDWFDLEIQSLESDPDYKKSSVVIGGVSAKQFVYDQKGESVAKSYYFVKAPFAYRVGFNYMKGGANSEFCRQSWEKSIQTFKFLKTPDFSEEGNMVEGETESYALLYEETGESALTVDLKFTEESTCNIGRGNEPCDESAMTIGDRVETWGYKSGNVLEVLWLGQVFDY